MAKKKESSAPRQCLIRVPPKIYDEMMDEASLRGFTFNAYILHCHFNTMREKLARPDRPTKGR